MNRALKRQIQNYLNDIAKRMPDGYPNQKQILDSMRHNLNNYIEEHPSARFEDVIEEFGSVSDIVDSFMDELPATDIGAAFQKRRRYRKFLLCACIFLSIGFLCLCRYLYYLYDHTATAIEETLIVIDTENPESETIIYQNERKLNP